MSPKTIRYSEKLYARLLVLPTIIVLIAIVVFPLIFCIQVSLKDYDLRMPPPYPFVGAANYVKLFSDDRFIASLYRTFLLVAMCTTTQLLLGLGIALMIYYHLERIRKYILVILAIPPMISPVVVGYMGRLIFHPVASPVNYILSQLGLPAEIRWHASPSTALLTVYLVDTWQWTPFIMLILLAAILAIPKDFVDCARVYGASFLHEIRYVILPLIKPAIAVAVLFRMLDILRMFDVIYVLTYGGPGTVTEVVTFYAYLTSFNYWKIGYGAAMSWILMIILTVICMVYLRLLRL